MAKYKESSTQQTITKYSTPATILIDLVNNPRIKIDEVRVEELNGKRVGAVTTRTIVKEIIPGIGSTEFDAVNENTGEVVATLTYAQLRHILYGLYLSLASETDG